MCEALKEIVREDLQEEFAAAEQRGKKDGIEYGVERGIEQMESLIQRLLITSRSDEIERAVTDKEYQKHLFQEFGL